MKNIILFFLFSVIQHFNCSIISLPFKRNITSNIDETNFYSAQEKNVLYTSIKIGDPSTTIKLQIKMEQYSFCIRNDSLIYDYSNSKSYKVNGERLPRSCADYSGIIPSNESFVLGKENTAIENIKFMLSEKSTFFTEGMLGLRIHENNYETNGYGLISQLKAKKLIDGEIFFLNFDDEGFDGELIIGQYPHLMDRFKEIYPQYQFKTTNIFIPSYDIDYDLEPRSVYFADEEYSVLQRLYIRLENGFIKAPAKFEDAAYDIFFQKHVMNKKCTIKKDVTISYYSYICDDYEELDISKFPEIKFYISDINYNLTLTYEELFTKKDGKVYFMVLFDKRGYNAFWHVGLSFLKRNKLVFDMDKRLIGIYDKSIKSDNTKEPNYNIVIYVVVIIIACLVIIALIVFIIYKFVWKKRKNRANELLDENYSYDPQNADPSLNI